MHEDLIKSITGKIEVLTGLHIGAGDARLGVGGSEHPVIVDRKSGEPYIPGSSLKGRLRALLENTYGLSVLCNGAPLTAKIVSEIEDSELREKGVKIIELFGSVAFNDAEGLKRLGLSRVASPAVFLDGLLTDEAREAFRGDYLEIKNEAKVDRITGRAYPRQIERIKRGVSFNFAIRLKKFLCADIERVVNTLKEGLELLELDALGGHGSRGYGSVKLTFEL
jgi:CRISPR-associated protein Csm3